MTHYLVLYDTQGTPQRVAETRSNGELQSFLDAGFIEVEKDVYDSAASTVERTGIGALQRTIGVLAALASVASRRAPTNVQQNRALLLQGQSQFNRSVDSLSQRLVSGSITPDEWFNEFMVANRRVQLQAASASVGGKANLGAQQIQVAQARLNEQMRYAQGFRDRLQGVVDSSDLELRLKPITSTSRMYGTSSNATYEIGFQLAIGIPALPAQPGVRTICMTNCKCRWVSRKLEGNGDWDFFWRLAPAEHCETCLARARLFNPLQIRNGRIVMPSGATSQIYA